ncbi:MAG: sigma-70 family RNA polymerase sigma factor [Pseudomonadota bacterium]
MSEESRVYDELLALLARGGDARAADRLVARWHPRLMRTARRLLRDDDLAREAVQETWVGVLKGLPRLRDPARFPAWTFGVLHRKCADRMRAAVRSRARETALTDETAGAAPHRDERSLAIAQAFHRLDGALKPAALLFYREGLTVAEIALAVGAPVGTVKSRLFAARSKLKEMLKGEDDERVR